MNRKVQYLVLAGTFAVVVALSYVGFMHTGGAVPWGKRFSMIVQGGATAEGGSLIQIGRGGIGGLLLADPLRDDILPFVLLMLLLVGGSLGLYWWSHTSD